MYYAAYNHYGITTAFGDYNIPVLHVFSNKSDRDKWVHDCDDADYLHREEVNRKTFDKYKDYANVIKH